MIVVPTTQTREQRTDDLKELHELTEARFPDNNEGLISEEDTRKVAHEIVEFVEEELLGLGHTLSVTRATQVLLVMAVGEEAMETMLSMATNPEVRQALEEAPDLSSVLSADVIQQVVEEIRSKV